MSQLGDRTIRRGEIRMTVKYHQSGLWIEQTASMYRIGLSEKGQDDIGEVMFVELPEFEGELSEGDILLGVEGAKAVTEILSPLNGQIKSVHKNLVEEPELLNSEDKEDNWILELESNDSSIFDSLNDDIE